MIGSPLHSKSFSTENIKNLEVHTSWGSIEVFGGDYQEIRIEVYAYNRGLLNLFLPNPMSKSKFEQLGFRIFKENETILIRSINGRKNWFDSIFSGHQVSFRIFVPRDISVNLSSSIGDLNLANITGKHTLKASVGKISLTGVNGSIKGLGKNFGGGIRVEHCRGDFELHTSGGNLHIAHSQGNHTYATDGGNVNISDFNGVLNAKTKGGNVSINRLSGELKAISWGGNIKLNGIRANVAATTKGGNIKADIDELKEYLWLESSGGNVRTYIPQNKGIQLAARAARIRASGNFHFSGLRSRTEWDGVINGGGCNVTLRSRGGNLTINEKETVPTPRPVASNSSEGSNLHSNYQFSEPQKSHQTKASPRNKSETPKVKTQVKPLEETKWKSFSPFIPSGLQVLYAFMFTILLVYGLNSITYFTSELFNPTSLEIEHNKAVALLNLTTGLSSFLGFIIFISFVEKYLQPKWLKYISLITLTCLSFFFVHLMVNLYFESQNSTQEFWQYFIEITRTRSSGTGFNSSKIFYSVIPSFVACAYFAFWSRSTHLSRKISEQEYQLLNMEKIKTKAQLTALEARINPHFLYNSLNSIAGLIHEDQDKAEDMTVELSKLFRATTGRNNESNHSINEEISLVKSYLAIEQMRFGNRLNYSINVEQKLNDKLIPRFLLQPLVENAIKHGISKIAVSGEIKVDIKEEGQFIVIDIHDNGPNFGEDISGGYGLKSVKDKLSLIYGDAASLLISNDPIKNIQIKIDKDHDL